MSEDDRGEGQSEGPTMVSAQTVRARGRAALKDQGFDPMPEFTVKRVSFSGFGYGDGMFVEFKQRFDPTQGEALAADVKQRVEDLEAQERGLRVIVRWPGVVG